MTVDGTSSGLLDSPIQRLKAGEFNRVPLVFGTNTDEFACGCSKGGQLSECLFANTLPGILPALAPPYNTSAIRLVLDHFLEAKLTDAQFSAALELYPVGGLFYNIPRLGSMLEDSRGWIGSCSTQYAAQAILAAGHSPIWLYHFAYLGNESTVGHFSEVPYVFQNCNSCGAVDERCCQGSSRDANDTLLSQIMGSHWLSFAQYGDPNHHARLYWPRYAANSSMMRFALPPRVDTHYREANCKFWEG